MARTVNKEDHAAKRNEILDATARLVMTKGYERMTIQDLLSELGMSNGAFFHYFDSKPAVLAAFIERIQMELEKPLLPILHDPNLSAIEKLQGFFDILDQVRLAHKREVIELSRVWYNDANALVRLKVGEATNKHRAPLISEIVRQGIQEGVFTTAYPDQSGDLILSLLQGMGDAHSKILLALKPHDENVEAQIHALLNIHEATMDAIERVIGAPSHALYRADVETVRAWIAAL